MYKQLLIFVTVLFISACSSVNKHIKKAEKYTQTLKIDKAIEEYKKALEIDKDNYKANAALGAMLCNYMNLYEDALPYLENAYIHSPKDTSADVVYALAKSYQFHGEYGKALQLLNKLDDVVAIEEDNNEFQKDVKKRKADCQYALQYQKEIRGDTKIINLGKNVNTKDPEYVPSLVNEELYFTSKRKDNQKEKFNEWDGKYFEAMYTAKMKNGSPEKVDYLYIPTSNKKIKSNTNKSIISISGNKKYLFIFEDTKITQVPIDSINTMKNKKLPPIINFSYYQSHAYLTKDGKTLYFTSDSENGIGGLDIYVSHKNPDGSWSSPENMGTPINTEYDEEAPFLSADEKTLYFASTGHPGFGNFDIYKSERVGDKWSEPVNLGQPINSSGHDIFYTEDDAQKNVYFSSYRPKGYGDMDIYKILYMDKFKNLPASDLKMGEIVAQKANDSVFHLSTKIPSPYEVYYPTWEYQTQSVNTKETDIVVPIGKTKEVTYEAILICDTCLNPIKIQLHKNIENLPTTPSPTETVAANNFVDIHSLPKGEIADNILASLGFDTSAVYFDFDKTDIKTEYFSKLNKNIEIINKYKLAVKIEGYSDLYGNAIKHHQISKDRATAVYKYLLHNGVSKQQILAYKGKGALKYCDEKDLEKCPDGIHARNRKVKIRVFKLNE